MELSQWIAVYSAISEFASSRERGFWVFFTGGLVGSSVLLALITFTLDGGDSSFHHALGLGGAALGVLLSLAWVVALWQLSLERRHWHRLLRSVESQFAGAEFHRSIHRLLRGDRVHVPTASWVCEQWHPEPAHFPWIARAVPRMILSFVPALFFLAFVGLLVSIAVMWPELASSTLNF